MKFKNVSIKQSFYSQLPANIHSSLYPKKLENIKIMDGTNRKSPNRISTSFYSTEIYTSPPFKVFNPTSPRGELWKTGCPASAPHDRAPNAAPGRRQAMRWFLKAHRKASLSATLLPFCILGEGWRLISKDIYTFFYRQNTEPSKNNSIS